MKNKEAMTARDTGAQRESIGTKIDTHLVPFSVIVAAAAGLNYGASKYDAHNFEKGLNMTDLTNSIDRHNRAIMGGEENDRDSGLPHYVLLASSIAMLVDNIVTGVVVEDITTRLVNLNVSDISSQMRDVETMATERRGRRGA